MPVTFKFEQKALFFEVIMRNKTIIKNEIENLKVQIRRQEKKSKEKINIKWVFKIVAVAFLISFLFSFISELTLPNVDVFLGIVIIILFVFLGIIFDIIGVAVTSASEQPFHSMNSRKVKGADVAVLFKKNADRVASFCNDVIGDICGIISGGACATVSIKVASSFNCDAIITSLILTSLVAALTIGGKAIGKSYAMNKSTLILYKFAKFVSNFYKVKK